MSDINKIKTGQNFSVKEEIRTYWSGRAAAFDESASHRIDDQYGQPQWHDFLRRAFELSAGEDLAGKHVLDIACGTGEVSRMVLSLGANVTGLDFSDAMHALSTDKLQTQNWSPLSCDAEHLAGVPDNHFDYAITRHLVWTLTDPDAAFAEWARVLKPGGKLLIIDGDWCAPVHRIDRLKRWVADQISTAPTRSESDRKQDQSIREQFYFKKGLQRDMLQTKLAEAGFLRSEPLSVKQLYREGMRGWPLATRLRQTHANRFAVVAVAP